MLYKWITFRITLDRCMIDRLRDALRQLRWKLTFSYTAVAVGTLLIVAFIVALLIFPAVLTPGGFVTEERWITATNEQVLPAFYGAFIQSPPDPDLIDQLLVGADRIAGTIASQGLLQVGQIELVAKASADVDFALVDASGALMGTSDRGMIPAAEYGQVFDPELVPGLAGPLKAALAGETDPEQLFSVVDPDAELVWAVPVFGVGRAEGQLLGAIITRLDSVPTGGDLLAHTLTLVARSLLLSVLAAGIIGGIFGSLTAEGMVSRLDRLRGVTEAWSRGDFSRFVHDPTGDELGLLGRHLNTMAVQLKELLKRNQQMAIAEERNRLARELHDSAKQQALAASFQLATAVTLLEEDPAVARKHVLEAENLVDSVRLELTDLIHELRPPDMEERALGEMIDQYAIEWAHQNDIPVELTLEAGDDVPLETCKAVYRITQEALANVARHSGATSAAILLNRDGGVLALTITDDGRGFDPEAFHAGLGLRSMRERVESLKGELSVRSEPGHGTTLSVTIPLD
jgi:signal transduction histidine kinase